MRDHIFTEHAEAAYEGMLADFRSRLTEITKAVAAEVAGLPEDEIERIVAQRFAEACDKATRDGLARVDRLPRVDPDDLARDEQDGQR